MKRQQTQMGLLQVAESTGCRRFVSSRVTAVSGRHRIFAVVATLVVLAATRTCPAEEMAARRLRMRNELLAALEVQDRWLGDDENARAWRRWLNNQQLRGELEADTPSVIVLNDVLWRYSQETPGLERPEFADVRQALMGWLALWPEPTAGELANFARAGMQRGVEPDQLAARTEALNSAFESLEAHLSQRRTGPGWRAYLNWDALSEQLARHDGGDVDRLEGVLDRFQGGHAGLESATFRDVAGALESYCRSLRTARLDDRSGALAECLDGLATGLVKYERRGRERYLEQVASNLDWLERHDLGGEVVRAVRRKYVRPNLCAQIDGPLLLSPYEQTIDESFAIRDQMNGALITGTGRLTGRLSFELVPSDERAAIQLAFDGTMRSRTTGHAGPVGFSTSGTTRLDARTWLFANADGMLARPTEANAQTSLHNHGVWSNVRGPLRSRIVTRIGGRRIAASRGSSERTVSRQAQRDLERRLEAQIRELVNTLNESYVQMIRVPLSVQGLFPADLRVSSTDAHLCLKATQAASGQLAAMSPMPALPKATAMSAAIHESAINNSTSTLLSGRTIESYELADILEQMLGSVPDDFDNVDGIPWSLTLSKSRPLEVGFDDQLFEVTIRCEKIAAGPEEFNVPFSVTAVYRGNIEDDAIVFRRQGDVKFSSPMMTQELGEQGEQAADRFRTLFAEESRYTVDQLPMELPPNVEIFPTRLDSEDCWLVVAFDARVM